MQRALDRRVAPLARQRSNGTDAASVVLEVRVIEARGLWSQGGHLLLRGSSGRRPEGGKRIVPAPGTNQCMGMKIYFARRRGPHGVGHAGLRGSSAARTRMRVDPCFHAVGGERARQISADATVREVSALLTRGRP